MYKCYIYNIIVPRDNLRLILLIDTFDDDLKRRDGLELKEEREG